MLLAYEDIKQKQNERTAVFRPSECDLSSGLGVGSKPS